MIKIRHIITVLMMVLVAVLAAGTVVENIYAAPLHGKLWKSFNKHSSAVILEHLCICHLTLFIAYRGPSSPVFPLAQKPHFSRTLFEAMFSTVVSASIALTLGSRKAQSKTA